MGRAQRAAVLGAVAMTPGLLAGCAPPPQLARPALACDAITVRIGFDPYLDPVARETRVSLALANRTPCTDTTGRGITFASIESFGLLVSGASCTSGAGSAGTGSGTLFTSDGSIATVGLTLAATGPTTGTVGVTITEGPLAGYRASAAAAFRLVDGGGTCADGVRLADIDVAPLTFLAS